MTIKILIECDNAAFDGAGFGPEVSRILADLAKRFDGPIEPAEMRRNLYDVNGNKVGTVQVGGAR